MYFKNSSRQETEKEKLLLAYQVNEEIVHGRFPLNRDLALELASLMTQVGGGLWWRGGGERERQTDRQREGRREGASERERERLC